MAQAITVLVLEHGGWLPSATALVAVLKPRPPVLDDRAPQQLACDPSLP